MKITDKILEAFRPQAVADQTRAQAESKANSSKVAEQKKSEEAVEVSSDFGNGNSVKRQDKVDKLKAAYADGSYNPDSTAVAAAFLKEVSYLS